MAEHIWERLLFSKQGIHYFSRAEKEANAARDVSEIVSGYMRSEGFRIRDVARWTRLSRDEVVIILAMQLSEDMAYGSRKPAGISAEAQSLASEFPHMFSQDVTFYSNGEYSESLKGRSMEFTESITDATFDGGVIGLDKDKIAYIWFEDED